MARRIERCSATHAWLVCERDGEVAGYAYGAPLKDRAAYRWTVEVSVYVGEGFARQGVGRELYQALFELMRRQGLRRIVAGITLPNDASVALHEGLGLKQGAWRDVSWWQLDLPGGDAPPTEPGLPQRLSASP
jgi:phosphinothricin acetyltransferase